MDKIKKLAIKVTKEIVVKFIEVGRISPTNFGEHFKNIYNQILHTISSEVKDHDIDKDEDE